MVSARRPRCASPKPEPREQANQFDLDGDGYLTKEEYSASALSDVMDFDALDANGDGSACLAVALDAGGQLAYRVDPYDSTQQDLQALLDGTLLMDIYNDCIKALVDALKAELTPETPEDSKALVGPAQRRAPLFHHDAVTALLLGPIQIVVGDLQQRLGALRRLAGLAQMAVHADGGRDRNRVLGRLNRALVDRAQDALEDRRAVGPDVGVVHHQRELLAPEPRQDVGRADRSEQAPCESDQHLVPDVVAGRPRTPPLRSGPRHSCF